MAQQVIDVGISASDGTGDPLRDAFTKINDNFTELYGSAQNQGLTYGNVASNVTGITFNISRYTESYTAQPVLRGTGQSVGNVYVIRGNVLGGSTPINDVYLTVTSLANITVGNIATVSAVGIPASPVLRVNGLTGNVTLTVNNVTGAASKAYVDAVVAANLSTATGTITDSLNANITAANTVIANHTSRITALESNAATQASEINNLTNTRATITYVDTSISNALSSNAVLANVAAVNANVSAANAAILLRANLSGATFTGNVTAANLTAVDFTHTKFLNVGTESAPNIFTNRGASFVSNISDFYGIYLNNRSPIGTSDYLAFPDGNQSVENYVSFGIAGSQFFSTRYPQQLPNDAFLYTVGGNLYLESETHSVKTITANVVRMEVQQSGTVKIFSNLTFADGTIQTTAFGGNINLNSVNANINAANAAIASLQSNSAAQALDLNSLYNNAAIQATTIDTLVSNAAIQAIGINNFSANLGQYQIYANANLGAQFSAIGAINANIIAANLNIVTLLSNAATQSLELSNLQSNAQIQQSNITLLQNNAAAQALAIDSINSNITAANINVGLLTSNSAVQATQINLLNANLTAANARITSLQANAATQALDIDNLYANVNFYLANVASSNANIAAANARILVLDANLGSTSTNIGSLQSNAAIQAAQLNLVNANITAANLVIDTKVSYVNGNLLANYFIANANVKVSSIIEVGELSPIDYPGLGGVFVGNANSYYQVVVQNKNNGTTASGDFVITADDGTDTDKYLNIGINSSGFTGNFIVPAGDTGLVESPYDGYLNVIGGNAIVRTDHDVYLAANTAAVALEKDGNFSLITGNLRFKDGTIQSTANIGALSYTPNNAANYNGTITNIQQALDQLAARLRALGG